MREEQSRKGDHHRGAEAQRCGAFFRETEGLDVE